MSDKKTFITDTGVLNFDKNLFEVDEKEKYSCAIMVPKSAISKEIRDEVERLGKDFKGKWKKPYKELDHEGTLEKRPDLKGYYIINMSTKFAFPVVDRRAEEITRADIGSGDNIRASISFYTYTVEGNTGVATNVLGIQKVSDGEKIYSAPSAKAMFGSLDSDSDESEDDDF